MTLKITFQKTPAKGADTLAIPVYEGNKPVKTDTPADGIIAAALGKNRKFNGAHGETVILPLPGRSGPVQAVLIGLGREGDLDIRRAEEAGGKLFIALEQAGTQKAVLYSGKGQKKISAWDLAAHLAAGAKLRSYKFERYKSRKETKKPLTSLALATDAHDSAHKTYDSLEKTIRGIFFARDLVNEPPNTLYPDSFARILKKELAPLGVQVKILDEKEMKSLGMGAILAVGMGSARPPRMVVMRWNGKKTAAKDSKPLAFVGKGVTFDTGGVSIKPAAGMDEMKMDMGGAAAVAGLMRTLALRKSRADVIGIVGLAENMPSGTAYRPADIIKSYAGKTIEVLNTDAEGRLVLADCLSYVQKTYKPRLIVDLATLTGAMMIALGHEYCGTFVNNDDMWKQLEKASATTGEKLWRMPLDEAWKKEMESPVADLQNAGNTRNAGACTAAGFLEHFIEGKTPWAHMDIAGTAWSKRDRPTVPKFGSGFGVRVLDAFVAQNYE